MKHSLSQQIDAIQEAMKMFPQDGITRSILNDAASTIAAINLNPNIFERVEELEKIQQSIVRLKTDDVCELAMEFLDMNNPDPDKVGDIAERLGMVWDESTEEFLDLENCQLRFHHRHEIYAKNSEIFHLKERIKQFEFPLNQQ